MPLDSASFPAEVQVAFFIFSILSDRWEGMSGSYMGKDWAPIKHLLNIYEVEDKRVIVYIMKMYEGILISYRAEKAEQRRKAEERKSKAAAGGGKNFTHNIRG